MIYIKYDKNSEKERKRVEYILKRWSNVITKPDGVVIMTEDENVKELVRELMAKTSRERVKAYKIEEAEVDVKKTRKVIELLLPTQINVVEQFVGFLMAKRKGVFKRELTKGTKEYDVYTRKGKSIITVQIADKEDSTKLRIKIDAFEPAATYLYQTISEELEYFKGGLK